MKLFLVALVLALAASVSVVHAVDAQAFTHRIHGLCCPERDADLRAIVKDMPGVTLSKIDFENGEATFEYDPLTLCAEKLKSMSKKDAAAADLPKLAAEHLDRILKQVSNNTFAIAPPSALPKDKLERVEIPIAGLDCKACSYAAYESVYKLDGVDRATASFKKGLVTAWIDPAKTNRAALEAALKKKGVDVKTPADATPPAPK